MTYELEHLLPRLQLVADEDACGVEGVVRDEAAGLLFGLGFVDDEGAAVVGERAGSPEFPLLLQASEVFAVDRADLRDLLTVAVLDDRSVLHRGCSSHSRAALPGSAVWSHDTAVVGLLRRRDGAFAHPPGAASSSLGSARGFPVMTKAVRSQMLVTRSAMRSRLCAAQMRRVARSMVPGSESM